MTAISVNTIVEISMASLVLDLFVDEQGSGTSWEKDNRDYIQIKINRCMIFVLTHTTVFHHIHFIVK